LLLRRHLTAAQIREQVDSFASSFGASSFGAFWLLDVGWPPGADEAVEGEGGEDEGPSRAKEPMPCGGDLSNYTSIYPA
jgi:hypothetical protein